MTGIFLRFYRAGELFIFADEIHSLVTTLTRSFSWILTHFTANDSCIPLTLYNKLLLETMGLSEWGMRFPSLVAGSILLILFGLIVYRHTSGPAAILSTGILAFSPYFVYMSREARPYMITTLLFNVAMICLFWWKNGGRKSCLWGAAVCCAFCIYFHPITAPSVAVLMGFSFLYLCLGKPDKKNYIHYGVAVILFASISLALLGPTIPSLLDGLSHKENLGKADIQTIRHGMILLLGLPVILPVWIWIALGVKGGAHLFRKWPGETTAFIAALFLQVIALFIIQPELNEIPWVWFRYVVHLIPVFIVLCVLAVTGLWEKDPEIISGQKTGQIVALAVVGLFFIYHLHSNHYRLKSTDRFTAHPISLFLPDVCAMSEIQDFVLDFYQNKLKTLPGGIIVETPLLVTFPLYGIYQKWHGRNIVTAPLGDGFAQGLFDQQKGLKLKTLVSFENVLNGNPVDVRYVIVHKRIKEEMKHVFNILKKDKMIATQLTSMAYLFNDRLLDILFGEGDIKMKAPVWQKATPIFEDHFLAVYDVEQLREHGYQLTLQKEMHE